MLALATIETAATLVFELVEAGRDIRGV